MSENESHTSFLESCFENKKAAQSLTKARPALSPEDPKVRFPGFRQSVTVFKAGQQVQKGAKRLPIDLVMHESVPVVLSDGAKLYYDLFLPAGFEDLEATVEDSKRIPALVAWSPYGKQLGTTVLDDFPFRAGAPKHWLSGPQKWEGPDPAFWCAKGYAIVNIDTRGAYTSDGGLLIMGHQEAQDGAEFVIWLSERPWCNGEVGLTGNSWLAMSQWKIGSLRPKDLAVLAPWEGIQDIYRDIICQGGVPSPGFHDSIADTLASYGKLEDMSGALRSNPLWNEYWEGKRSKPEQIDVPTYVVASWTNPIHTSGTLRAYRAIPGSVPKWLRVHDSQEWPDYCADSSCCDLKRFFDYFLKGHHDNGWLATPKVRLSILNFGLSRLDDTVNRSELEWPLARIVYRKLYLTPDHRMSPSQTGQPGSVGYDSRSGSTKFRYRVPADMEATGHFTTRLTVSCPSSADMDLFVQVCCLRGPSSYKQGVLTIRLQNTVVLRLLKLLHDWQVSLQRVGMLFHWGPNGQLRVSHAHKKSTLAAPFESVYDHVNKIPLAKGETWVVEVPLRPYGMYWQRDDIMELTISGNPVIPFPLPGVPTLKGRESRQSCYSLS